MTLPDSIIGAWVIYCCAPNHMVTNKDCAWLMRCFPAGELFLEFTQISAAQPERPYGFAVQVLEDEKYKGAGLLMFVI